MGRYQVTPIPERNFWIESLRQMEASDLEQRMNPKRFIVTAPGGLPYTAIRQIRSSPHGNRDLRLVRRLLRR